MGFPERAGVRTVSPRMPRRSPTLVWHGVLGLLLVALSSVAHAQATAEEPAGYREAIRAAIEEYEAQSYVEAREQFRRAHALYPNARTLRGLGLTEYELHNYPESVRHLEQALASDVRPLDGKTRGDTQAVLDRAKTYVGTVVLKLDPPTTVVMVDEHQLEPAEGNLLLLSVGEHLLEFRATGRMFQRRGVTVKGGEKQTLHVTLSEEPVASAQASTPGVPASGEREPGRTPVYKKWWLWTVVGVAVAGGVAGTLYATRREIRREEPFGTSNTPVGGALSTR